MTDVSPNLFVGNPLCDKCLGHHPMNWDCQADKPSLIPTPVSPETKALPPIERNEEMDRTYIPLPGGWEVQTKGKGSSFRLADVNSDERYLVIDEHLHEPLIKMAMDIRAGYSATLAPLTEEEATAVGRVVGDASNHWMSSIVHGEEHLIVQVAFNALVQLRTATGEKK
jgi:hypothetical protein